MLPRRERRKDRFCRRTDRNPKRAKSYHCSKKERDSYRCERERHERQRRRPTHRPTEPASQCFLHFCSYLQDIAHDPNGSIDHRFGWMLLLLTIGLIQRCWWWLCKDVRHDDSSCSSSYCVDLTLVVDFLLGK